MSTQCSELYTNIPSIAALNWDCGMLSMEYRVYQKKIMFLYYLVHLDDDSLAGQIFCTQKEHNLPGFVKEGRDLLKFFSLPNIVDDKIVVSKHQWKVMVKRAVNSKYEKLLQSKIQQLSKLKNGSMSEEHFEEKRYINEMSMIDARTLFRVRSLTTNVRMNQRTDKENAKNLWKCSECGNIDSQSHILWCPFHAHLREGKSLDNDTDLVKYFQQVFMIREERRLKDL